MTLPFSPMSGSGKDEKKAPELVWPKWRNPHRVTKTHKQAMDEYTQHGFIVEESTESADTKYKECLVVLYPVQKELAINRDNAVKILASLDVKFTDFPGGKAVWIHSGEFTGEWCGAAHYLYDGTFSGTGVTGMDSAKKLGEWLAMVFGFKF